MMNAILFILVFFFKGVLSKFFLRFLLFFWGGNLYRDFLDKKKKRGRFKETFKYFAECQYNYVRFFYSRKLTFKSVYDDLQIA